MRIDHEMRIQSIQATAKHGKKGGRK